MFLKLSRSAYVIKKQLKNFKSRVWHGLASFGVGLIFFSLIATESRSQISATTGTTQCNGIFEP